MSETTAIAKAEHSPEDREMLELLDVLLADAARAQKAHADDDSGAWLPEWYLGRMADLDAAEARIKEGYQRRIAEVVKARKTIQWQWGREFQARVAQDLQSQGGKKKSVNYYNGRAGTRVSGGKPTVVVEDEKQALDNAQFLCPEAVKRTLLVTPIKEYIAAHGELPGVHVETTPKEEKFYPWIDTVPTLEADEQPQLEGDGDVE